MFYLHKGDVDAAIDRFLDAIQRRPNFAKPRLLLGKAPKLAAYVPVDISADYLEQEAASLRRDFRDWVQVAWAAIRISHRALSRSTWPTISMDRGGKRMVMWSSGSSSRRACIPVSTAPAVLSTPTSTPARRASRASAHNQITRSA